LDQAETAGLSRRCKSFRPCNDYTIPAFRFRAIERLVRFSNQRFPVQRRPVGAIRHAEAHGKWNLRVPSYNWCRFDRLTNVFGAIGADSRVTSGQYQEKFLAAIPADSIVISHGVRQELCDGTQRHVACRVTECVVHMLEVIDVSQQ